MAYSWEGINKILEGKTGRSRTDWKTWNLVNPGESENKCDHLHQFYFEWRNKNKEGVPREKLSQDRKHLGTAAIFGSMEISKILFLVWENRNDDRGRSWMGKSKSLDKIEAHDSRNWTWEEKEFACSNCMFCARSPENV